MQNPGQQGYAYSAPTGGGEKSSTGLDSNVAGLLSYLFAPVGGVVFFLIEKSSRMVKLHAMQSILFGVLAIVVWIGLTIFAIILGMVHMGLLIVPIELVVGLALLIVWILMVVKAYQNSIFKLPILGNMAEGFVK